MLPDLRDGQDCYVCGFFMDYEMERFILIDKGGMQHQDVSLFWQGIGGGIKTQLGTRNSLRNIDYEETKVAAESAHEAMSREFFEETGYKIAMKRWHCFHTKEYLSKKIYFFAAFGSLKELHDCVRIASDSIRTKFEGRILTHCLVDVLFDGNSYTFDIPYLIQMILREMRSGMFMKLDPEGVNSYGKIA